MTIDQIIKSSTRPIIAFIGCGLSVPKPTCLPLNRELIHSFLNMDWVGKTMKFPVDFNNINEEAVYNLRFEYLLSTFLEWRRHDLSELLHQFADAPFNPYHKRISELCAQNKIRSLITTNFDCCLEKALLDIGITPNVIASEGDKYLLDTQVINIFKIHGSIESQNGMYINRNMKATLESLSEGLESWKSLLLKNLLNKYSCLFLGYSGSDSYDINHVLRSIQNPYYYWIAHRTRDIKPFIYQDVTEILSISINPYPIFVDTAIFLGIPTHKIRKGTFQLSKSYDRENFGLPSRVVGRVLESVEDYEGALKYYDDVIDNCNFDKYLTIDVIDVYRSKASCLYELGLFEDAKKVLTFVGISIREYELHLQSFDDLPEERFKNILIDQYLLYFEEKALVDAKLNDQDEAFSNIHQALKCAEMWESDENSKINCYSRLLMNLVSICLRFDIDKTSFGDSESVNLSIILELVYNQKKRIGDYGGVIKSLYLYGQVSLLENRPEEALQKFTEMAIEINRLASTVKEFLYELPTELFGLIVIDKLSNESQSLIGKYRNYKSVATYDFLSTIKEILKKHSYGNFEDLITKMMNDKNVKEKFIILNNEINE